MVRPTVKIVSAAEEFADLALPWEKLVAETGNPSPFISHAWLGAWWEHFRDDSRLYVFTVWSGEELRGAVPLMRTRFRIQRIFRFNCLHSLTNPHSPEFDVICRPDDLGTLIGLLKEHLEKTAKDWDLLILERVRAGSNAPGVLEEHFRDGPTQVNHKMWEGSYHIPIRGGFREYFSGLNRSFRKNIRNRNNKLAALGTPDFRVVRGYDPDLVETFFRLENTGWKRENRSSIALRPREGKFYHQIASRFAQAGEFNLALLSAGGEPIAAIYGLVRGRNFYFLKLGVNYDLDECDKLSPGQAILHHLIRNCFEERLAGFDFCGPFTPYERQWTKAERRKHLVTIYNLRQPRVKLFLSLKAALQPICRCVRGKAANTESTRQAG